MATYKAVDAFINNQPNRAYIAFDGWGGAVVADLGLTNAANMQRARLFAAAPELLEALELVECRRKLNTPLIIKIKAAIKKAKGE